MRVLQRWSIPVEPGAKPGKRWETGAVGVPPHALGCVLMCLELHSAGHGGARTVLWLITEQARNALPTESAGIAAEYGH